LKKVVILCVALIALLVPFAITNMATGFANVATSSTSLAVVPAVTIVALTGLASLWKLLTGMKKGPDRLQSHSSLAKILGRALSSVYALGTNLDTRITAAVGNLVGRVYNCFGATVSTL